MSELILTFSPAFLGQWAGYELNHTLLQRKCREPDYFTPKISVYAITIKFPSDITNRRCR